MPIEPQALRILVTNNALGTRAGSELYVRDLCLRLQMRGHHPVVYSQALGEVGDLLRSATVPVVDDLDALGFVPDLIHGQHHLETMTAVLRFPGVPAVYFCHGWLPWEELPPVHPSVRRYVAVDDLCAERLLTTMGIDPSCIDTIYNGVDLDRFIPGPGLPPRPRSALVFSNYAAPGGYADAIRAACQRFGIERFDVAGTSVGRSAREPEQLLRQYDIVFGKARCALEAMATGCATIVADAAGLAGMVTMHNVERLRRLNFGVRTMQAAVVTEDAVLEQLHSYDAADAARVCDWIRADASFDASVDRILGVYRIALAQPPRVGAQADAKASAFYLRSLSGRLKSVHDAERRAGDAGQAVARLELELGAAQEARVRSDEQAGLAAEDNLRLESGIAQATQAADAARAAEMAQAADAARAAEMAQAVRASLEDSIHTLEHHLAELRATLEDSDVQLAAIRGSRTWRALAPYRRLRAWLT